MTIEDKFARSVSKLLVYATNNDIDILAISLFRTVAQQQAMFAKGVSRCDGVRSISKHQLGRAIDIVILRGGSIIWDNIPEYTQLGEYWESLGGRWGGRWSKLNDIYHFEM